MAVYLIYHVDIGKGMAMDYWVFTSQTGIASVDSPHVGRAGEEKTGT